MFFGTPTIHKDGSFVRIRSDVIKAKCEAVLIAIEAIRQERVKKTIEEGRQQMMKGFWHRLLRRPVPTDDQVKAYLSDGMMISETFWDEISFYKNEEVAKKLLNSCTYAEEIFVSTEDLERLW